MRITRPTNKRALFFLPALIAVIFACSATFASAETLAPWWGLTSEARPATNLQEAPGKDEVQQLTVSATKGDVVLVNTALFSFEEFLATGKSKGLAVVPYNVTASQLEGALEAIYPSRKVTVTGGPGATAEESAYSITFPSQSLEPPVVQAGGGFLGGEPLSCEGAVGSHCTAEPTIAEVAKGESGANITIVAENLGDANTNSSSTPVSIADSLPAGLEAIAIEGFAGNNLANRGLVECSLSSLTCKFSGALPPYEVIEVHVSVGVGSGATSGEENVATVAGGGAAGSKTSRQTLQIGGGKRFGIEDYELTPESVGGSVDTQAGSHPFQLTNVITFNREPAPEKSQPVALPKDIISELPVGLLGNPTPFTQCTDQQFWEGRIVNGNRINGCPSPSAIGVADVTYVATSLGLEHARVPIFNMTPLNGEPARFAFAVLGAIEVVLDTSVRTGGDYGVTVTANNIIQVSRVLGTRLTFWGVPGDPRHDGERGWECLEEVGQCPSSTDTNPPPFLVMPTSCERPYESTLRADSWAAGPTPSYQAAPVTYRLPEAIDGCNHLPFSPSISAAPDVPNGSTSTGLTADVHVPQEAALNPNGLAESSIKDIAVTLPEGVALNPSGADGLEACSEGQIGFTGVEAASGTDLFTPDLPSPFCPNGAKIGTAKIKTPLLANPLEGEVYLAAQNANPFGSLIAMYIVAEDPVSGTLVKLPGAVSLNQGTGQITTTFKNSPELPFEDAELHFFGGERAPLATPAHCGTYTTNASFVPWSGSDPVASRSSFAITAGPNGGPCPGASLPFSPSLSAGTTNIQAGAFSPLVTTISREDGQQDIQSVVLHMPSGLSGVLSGVKLCAEAQADAGTCGPGSSIGHTIVSVGLGGNPFSVTGGEVFLTEGYGGAPFGLSIVNPAVAGPFNLGMVVVRAKVDVDPGTAALTVTTDSSGPYAIPHILDGIPLQIKHVNVTIDRPGFTFNSTNCSPRAITGTVSSATGVSSPVSVPFQVTNCATLKFAPKFAVSTSGKTSKANGASLSVKLTYPQGPLGTYANIARVKVDLPKQLPSRLTTLQKACTAAQFNTNPAGCPAASIIGHAKAITPILPVPLEGPAYFVSHGGEAFPSLIVVLQGYGVKIDLVGTTFISKTGITSSTFKTVPDQPVTSFDLTLPEGKYSALAANGNLCKTKLAMPTEFLAQNGAKINQSTKISVTGCPKAKKTKKAAKKKAKKNGQGNKRGGASR